MSEIERKIQEYVVKLQDEAYLTPRIKKRIWAKLGSLKKQLETEANVEPVVLAVVEPQVPLSKKERKAKLHLLNKDLSSFAVQKLANRARSAVKALESKGIELDVSTYTNLINVYVRCDEIEEAEATLQKMQDSGIQPNEVTLTTMLKGYCETSNIEAATTLFNRMTESKLYSFRSVSTYLRGCQRVGAVQLAMSAYQNTIVTQPQEHDPTQLSSCYEILVSLLCQAGRLSDASDLLKSAFQFMSQHDDTLSDALSNAGLYTYLARTTALLGNHSEAGRYHTLANQLLDAEDRALLTNTMKRKFDEAIDNNDEEGPDQAQSESKSVQLFRQHRRKELRQVLSHIGDYLAGTQALPPHTLTLTSLKVYSMALSQLIYFDRVSIQEADFASWLAALIKGLKSKFGLSTAALTNLLTSAEQKQELKLASKCVIEKVVSLFDPVTRQLDLSTLFHTDNTATTATSTTSTTTDDYNDADDELLRLIDPTNSMRASTHIPIKVEIGAGNGDWIVAQAELDRLPLQQHDRQKRIQGGVIRGKWIALELRCDRVYHILTQHLLALRAIQTPPASSTLNNLAIFGGDAHYILSSHFPHASIDSFFINYPQPPERIKGGYKNQGKHLLTNNFFKVLLQVLRSDGTMTILTDNLLYGQCLLAGLLAIATEQQQQQGGGGRMMFVDAVPSATEAEANNHNWKIQQQETSLPSSLPVGLSSLTMWRGEPGPVAGHHAPASSYFDRMWSLGQKKRRWFIFVKKITI